jgi:hypothetical protein
MLQHEAKNDMKATNDGNQVQAPTQVPEVHAFSKGKRVFVTTVLTFFHFAILLFCLCHIMTYSFAPKKEIKNLTVWQPVFCIGIMTVLTLFHIYGIWAALCPKCRSNRISAETQSPTRKCWSPLEMLRLYFGNYGVFGLHGPLYDVRVFVRQAFQVPMQVYQAWSMAEMVSDPMLCAAYTLTLATNYISLPLLMYMDRQKENRFRVAFIDTVFDFFLGVGFLLAKLTRIVWQRYALGKDFPIESDTYMLAKYTVISSPLDCFCTSFLIFTSYLSCRTLSNGSRITTRYVNPSWK